MLKSIRRTIAAIFFVAISLLFLDFTGTLHAWLGWLAKIQFMPAMLAHSLVPIIILLVLTLLLGRMYCSVICPLGVYQDLVARLGKRGKKLPYKFEKAKCVLRLATLGVYVVAIVISVSVVVSLLDPYAIFGRAANNILQPVWILGNNVLAHFAQQADSYAFYSQEVWIRSIPTLIVAVVSIIIVSILAWRGGRTYCNTVCPVGTFLGFISRFSILKINIDKDKCNGCTLCERNCKSSCIDIKNMKIDHSRCVSCMNCIDVCKKSAVSFAAGCKQKQACTVSPEPKEQTSTNGRKEFLTSTLIVAASVAKAQVLPKQVEMKVDGGLADIIGKKDPNRTSPITPPGSHSQRNFTRHCTACQLCVSACPNGVLKPSSKLENFMQPQMSFTHGYCRPECNTCSTVCPAGAIKEISLADKSATQIGRAVWSEQRCIIIRDKKECYNCKRQCPTQAIQMVDKGFDYPVPVIDHERCIGCGACENLCPSSPISAIYVEGNNLHRTI